MKTEAEISAAATEGRRAFSNGTEYEIWASRWCYECIYDDARTEKYCPILTVAILGSWPAEWTHATEPYEHVDTCTEFEQRRDDDGPDEPEPDPVNPFDPEMPGQVDMFEVFVDQGLAELADQREAVTR